MSGEAVRNHYTKVCTCVWDGDDDWPARVELTADCVIHGDIPDPLDELLAENQRLREALTLILDTVPMHFYPWTKAREALAGGDT